MESLILRTPSVGTVIKKMIEINPDLTTTDLIGLVRQSILRQEQSGVAGEFAQAEVIDELKALRLARETVGSGTPNRALRS